MNPRIPKRFRLFVVFETKSFSKTHQFHFETESNCCLVKSFYSESLFSVLINKIECRFEKIFFRLWVRMSGASHSQ